MPSRRIHDKVDKILYRLTYSSFDYVFQDEESAQHFFEMIGMIPKRHVFESLFQTDPGVSCPNKCGNNLGTVVHANGKLGWRIRCRSKTCGKVINPLTNSWFEKFRLNFRDALKLLFGFVFKFSIKFMVFDLKVSKPTIIEWHRACREVCRYHNVDKKIGGPGLNVEIDETFLFTSKYNRGRPLKKIWCVGGICRETEEIFLQPLVKRSANILHQVIRRYVEPQTLIHTDCWKGYRDIEQPYNEETGKGCNAMHHFQVNHSYEMVDRRSVLHPETNQHFEIIVSTNKQERIWRELKKHIRSTRRIELPDGRQGTHAELYIEEFIYRYNTLRSLKDNVKFRQFLFDICDMYKPITPFNFEPIKHEVNIDELFGIDSTGLEEFVVTKSNFDSTIEDVVSNYRNNLEDDNYSDEITKLSHKTFKEIKKRQFLKS